MSIEPFALADQLTAASRWFQVIRNHMALTQGKVHENSCLKGLRVKRFLASIGVACGCLKSPKVRLEQVDLAKGSRLGILDIQPCARPRRLRDSIVGFMTEHGLLFNADKLRS